MTVILGISAFYHDSAAAMVIDGDIVAAAQEERFTRIKHDLSYPVNAISYCLEEAGLKLDQIDYISFYDTRVSETLFVPSFFERSKTDCLPLRFLSSFGRALLPRLAYGY